MSNVVYFISPDEDAAADEFKLLVETVGVLSTSSSPPPRVCNPNKDDVAETALLLAPNNVVREEAEALTIRRRDIVIMIGLDRSIVNRIIE